MNRAHSEKSRGDGLCSVSLIFVHLKPHTPRDLSVTEPNPLTSTEDSGRESKSVGTLKKESLLMLSPVHCQEVDNSATFIIVLGNLGVQDDLVRSPKVTMFSNCVNRRYPQKLMDKASSLHRLLIWSWCCPQSVLLWSAH